MAVTLLAWRFSTNSITLPLSSPAFVFPATTDMVLHLPRVVFVFYQIDASFLGKTSIPSWILCLLIDRLSIFIAAKILATSSVLTFSVSQGFFKRGCGADNIAKAYYGIEDKVDGITAGGEASPNNFISSTNNWRVTLTFFDWFAR
eukprot:Gb_13121 [translate_table: standard]